MDFMITTEFNPLRWSTLAFMKSIMRENSTNESMKNVSPKRQGKARSKARKARQARSKARRLR
jgi:hypothetical protein